MGAGNSGFLSTERWDDSFKQFSQESFLNLVRATVSQVNEKADALIEEDFKYLATHFKVKFTKVNLGEHPYNLRPETLFCRFGLSHLESNRAYEKIMSSVHSISRCIEQELIKLKLERTPTQLTSLSGIYSIPEEEKQKYWDMAGSEVDCDPFYRDNIIRQEMMRRLKQEQERKSEYSLEIYYQIHKPLIYGIVQLSTHVTMSAAIKVCGFPTNPIHFLQSPQT